METVTLIAISATIFVTLMIYKERAALHRSLAAICLALCLWKGGQLLVRLLDQEFWRVFQYLGLAILPPLCIRFTSLLLHQPTLPRRQATVGAGLLSLIILLSFWLAGPWAFIAASALDVYVGTVLLTCFLALVRYIQRSETGAEKKRLIYLMLVCSLASMIVMLTVVQHHAFRLYPTASDLVVAMLIYFVFLIISYPHLIKLYELMARALILIVMTLFSSGLCYAILKLFDRGASFSVTNLFVGIFIVVISVEPLKIILKRLFVALFPDGRDVFTSLYAYDQQLEKEKALFLQKMAPVLAHEILNPLGSIKGAAQFLRSEEQNAEKGPFLDVIIEEVNRLNRTLTQFLHFAKPYEPAREAHDLNQILNKVISVIKAGDIPANIVIRQDYYPALPPVAVDYDQMIQVLLNIGFNAIEAMGDNGTLTFRTAKFRRRGEDVVDIFIRDTGKGITAKEMKTLFHPFFTTKERGFGLGLAICHQIIRHHGGHIRVKSIPGRGSVFCITLPLGS